MFVAMMVWVAAFNKTSEWKSSRLRIRSPLHRINTAAQLLWEITATIFQSPKTLKSKAYEVEGKVCVALKNLRLKRDKETKEQEFLPWQCNKSASEESSYFNWICLFLTGLMMFPKRSFRGYKRSNSQLHCTSTPPSPMTTLRVSLAHPHTMLIMLW